MSKWLGITMVESTKSIERQNPRGPSRTAPGLLDMRDRVESRVDEFRERLREGPADDGLHRSFDRIDAVKATLPNDDRRRLNDRLSRLLDAANK